MKTKIINPGAEGGVIDSELKVVLNKKAKPSKLYLEEYKVKKQWFSDSLDHLSFSLKRTLLGKHWGYVCNSCDSVNLVPAKCPSCSNESAHFGKSKRGGMGIYCNNCDKSVIGNSWTCFNCGDDNPVNPIFKIGGISK